MATTKNKKRIMIMQTESDADWILAVKDLVVEANPRITVRQVFNIFMDGTDTMEFFHECRDRGETPAKCFAGFIHKFGKKRIGITVDSSATKQSPPEMPRNRS